MAQNKASKSFGDYWNDINEKLLILERHNQTDVAETAAEIRIDLKELKDGVNGLRIASLWLLTVTILLVTMALVTYTDVGGVQRLLASDFEVTKDSILNLTRDNEELSYKRSNGKIVSYPELMIQNDTLESRYNQMKSDLQLCKLMLESSELSVKSYQKILDSDKKEDYAPTLSTESAKQIDSAFILLRALRHRMSYDKETDTWTIKP